MRRQLNYQFDSLWRPTTLTDGSVNPLVKDVLYNVAGQMTGMQTRAWVYAGGSTKIRNRIKGIGAPAHA